MNLQMNSPADRRMSSFRIDDILARPYGSRSDGVASGCITAAIPSPVQGYQHLNFGVDQILARSDSEHRERLSLLGKEIRLLLHCNRTVTCLGEDTTAVAVHAFTLSNSNFKIVQIYVARFSYLTTLYQTTRKLPAWTFLHSLTRYRMEETSDNFVASYLTIQLTKGQITLFTISSKSIALKHVP